MSDRASPARPSPHGLALAWALLFLVLGLGAQLFEPGALAGRLWAAGIAVPLVLLSIEIVRGLARGETGVDTIAALAMGGALWLGEPLAGVVVAIMFTGGNVLEERARRHAERELTALLERAPRIARRERDGALETVSVEEVRAGDRLVVAQGEIVPVDGVLLDRPATLDESALTGESLPVRRAPGSTVLSGVLNLGPPLRLEARAAAAESTYAAIVRLVASAQASKAPLVRLADRYAFLFLPVTLAIAGAAWWFSGDPVRALAVLVVATPCPLILAAPVAIVAGMSAAARRGVLFKSGGALEALARARTLVFDKTGTLTTGRARLVAVLPCRAFAEDELLRLAASLDQVSSHPLAEAIVEAARARGLSLELPSEVREAPGEGIEGRAGGRRVRLGRLDHANGRGLFEDWAERVVRRAERDGATPVFVAVDGELAGALLLADEIRREAPRALRALRAAGLRRIVMLSGDRADVAEAIGTALGIDTVLAERSPADKVDAVRAERAEGITAMVGDGINDAPALAAAHVGIAMGARGAAAAAEAADAVLLVDRLDRVVDAIRIAVRARRIALESVLAGMGLSGAAMLVAAFGWLPPVAGALVQEAIDVAVILNALRALRADRGAAVGRGLPAERVAALEADHRALHPVIARIRALADRLGAGDGPVLAAELRALLRELEERVLAHERKDELELHPEIAAMLGGRDPMAPISRTHREINHLVRRLRRLAAELPPEGPLAEDLPELRRTLYALEAILELHCAQEEELYEAVALEPEETGALRGRARSAP
ncbi:MAG: heavy metal translocating P-type ATPase [Geminicoccaceae bacterium]|nr:heavy metal translocating P-type ATPase [Geminicoccaceae bacterium]